MKTTKCNKCNREIKNCNYEKHFKSCNNIKKSVKKLNDSWRIEENKYKCPYCEKIFCKNGICSHIWRKHEDGKNFKSTGCSIAWNKGLTKETDIRVKKIGETLKRLIKNKKVVPSFYGKKHSDKTKRKLSDIMKKRHADGLAWNIGKSRWNNEQSYPEKFFQNVIENEFEDKNFKCEYNIGIYSIDFAWPDKKLAIEIDGTQHHRFKEYIERDKRKDKFLKKQGWKILRINWKEMCNDTKKWIKIASNFINY